MGRKSVWCKYKCCSNCNKILCNTIKFVSEKIYCSQWSANNATVAKCQICSCCYFLYIFFFSFLNSYMFYMQRHFHVYLPNFATPYVYTCRYTLYIHMCICIYICVCAYSVRWLPLHTENCMKKCSFSAWILRCAVHLSSSAIHSIYTFQLHTYIHRCSIYIHIAHIWSVCYFLYFESLISYLLASVDFCFDGNKHGYIVASIWEINIYWSFAYISMCVEF